MFSLYLFQYTWIQGSAQSSHFLVSLLFREMFSQDTVKYRHELDAADTVLVFEIGIVYLAYHVCHIDDDATDVILDFLVRGGITDSGQQGHSGFPDLGLPR